MSTKPEQLLRAKIAEHLDTCCDGRWPNLKEYISTDHGREQAQDMAFYDCANNGVSVQTALSSIDTRLSHE